MTTEIRNAVQRHRKRSMLVLLALLAAGALSAVVIPAFAAVGDTIPPGASPSGVVPTVSNIGGSNFSCFATSGGAGRSAADGIRQFTLPGGQTNISNPSPGTYTDGATGATITFRAASADPNKFVSFVFTGGKVTDIAIKGGTDTAWYKYLGGTTGAGVAVAADGPTALNAPVPGGWLHSTTNNKGAYNVASITTICFQQIRANVSGRVFHDFNRDGVPVTGSALAGWTMTLLRASDGVQVAQATTGATGTYTFPNVPAGTYKVCEAAGATTGYTPAASWRQTVPATGVSCPGALARGRSVTITASTADGGDVTGQDFGNVAVVTSTCGQTVRIQDGDDSYEVQVQGTAGKCAGTYVLSTYGSATTQRATFVPYDVTLTGKIAVVEKISWTGPQFGPDQNTVRLWYDDGNLVGTVDRTQNFIKLCTVDPRANVATAPFVLPTGYDAQTAMPSGKQIDTTTDHTSCALSITYAPTATSGQYAYTAFVLSSVDGIRGIG